MAKEYIQAELFNDDMFNNDSTEQSTGLYNGKAIANDEKPLSAPQKGHAKTAEKLPKKRPYNLVADEMRLRSQTKRIRVEFPDGAVFCDKSTTQTLIKSLQHIGLERVASAKLEVSHVPLVAQSIAKSYEKWIKPIGNGWFVMLQSDSDQKYRQLLSLNEKLQLGMKLEMNADLTPLTDDKYKEKIKRGKKKHIAITLPDGTAIKENAYVKIICQIGSDKIARTNLKAGSKRLITSTQQYSNQVNVGNNCWLTVPTLCKDQYKILKIVSSITRTPFKIEIV